MEYGGIGEHFIAKLIQKGYRGRVFLRGIGDFFVRHASMEESLHDLGLDAESIFRTVIDEEGEPV